MVLGVQVGFGGGFEIGIGIFSLGGILKHGGKVRQLELGTRVPRGLFD